MPWLAKKSAILLSRKPPFTTALSLVAQYMLGMKWIENWYFWMVADVIYIGLYQFKGLSLTALLYALFFVMCIAGWREWSKTLATTIGSGGMTQ